MDQNSTNGTDKRSWRERLGIGAGKEMPRIADEFQAAAAANGTTAARPAVKPAPMAPRVAVKPAPPRPATSAAAPAATEKLADKLKAQREAQERLAEQRVQAAKQRSETRPAEAAVNGSAGSGANGAGAKPKFTFAEEEPAPAKTAPEAKPAAPTVPLAARQPTPAAAQQRPVPPPPAVTPPASTLTPPRQALGTERPAMPPRPQIQPPPVVPSRPPQQRFAPPPATGYPPQPNGGYSAQVPPYRPADPAARGYVPNSFPTPPYSPAGAAGYGGQPRLNVPPLSGASGYGAEAYGQPGGQARHLRPPTRTPVGYRDDLGEGDIFDDPRAGRRATAGDYNQAYRDVSHGYDEELPPSRGPWVPLMLLALLLVGLAGGYWYYKNYVTKPLGAATSTTNANTPVVEPPAQKAKTTPEPAAEQSTGQPSKKLIYDRIVGDREVLGGDVLQSNEVPTPLGDGAQDVQPAGGGEELVPLPLPPPPGEDGAGDQQGAAPSTKTSSEALNEPAAGASQAAASSSGAPSPVVDANEQAPAPGEIAPAAATGTESETISDPASDTASASDFSDEPAAELPPKKKVAETAEKPKKTVAKKTEKSLGSDPVVLVPPADGTATIAAEPGVADSTAVAGSGGLYGGEGVVDANTPAVAVEPPVKKKKRTLADLFKGENDQSAELSSALSEEPAPVPAQKPKAASAAQPETPQAPQQQTQQVAAATGYVVQLASFPSKNDASLEFSRLKAKHASTLSGLAPIVSQAEVGGSTRYRLAAGTFTTREQASAVCAKLLAAGERDCLVRRQ